MYFYIKKLFSFTSIYILEENTWFSYILEEKGWIFFFNHFLQLYVYYERFFLYLKNKKINSCFNWVQQCPVNNKYTYKKMILLNWSKISSIYNVDQLEKCYRTIAGAESKTIIDKMHCQNQYFPTEYLQFVTEFIDSSIRCIWFKFFVAFIKYRKSYNLRHIRVLVFVGKFMSEILLWYAFTYHS